MNVFRYEMWQYRRGLFGWSLGLALFLCIYLPFMPAFLDQSQALKTFFEGVGPAFTEALGLDIKLFFGPLGFYSFLFVFFTLLASIQAVSLGLSIISKENRMKTADFLLTKPKSRSGIFGQKLLSALLCLAITEAVFYTVATVGMLWASKGDLPIKPFVFISFTLSLIQLFLLALGLFVAVVVPKIKSTLTVAVGISVGCFLLGMLANLTGNKVLRLFAPTRYFDNNYIMTHDAYETKYLVLCLVVSAVLLLAAYLLYVKKDVKAV